MDQSKNPTRTTTTSWVIPRSLAFGRRQKYLIAGGTKWTNLESIHVNFIFIFLLYFINYLYQGMLGSQPDIKVNVDKKNLVSLVQKGLAVSGFIMCTCKEIKVDSFVHLVHHCRWSLTLKCTKQSGQTFQGLCRWVV